MKSKGNQNRKTKHLPLFWPIRSQLHRLFSSSSCSSSCSSSPLRAGGEMKKISVRSGYKQENDFEKRKSSSSRMKEKYPDRIPVIVEKADGSDVPNIDKNKFLVPSDMRVGDFVFVIRKRINLSAEKAIFIFIDNILPSTGALISKIYQEKKDEDGFLYIVYSGENTFGHQNMQ